MTRPDTGIHHHRRTGAAVALSLVLGAAAVGCSSSKSNSSSAGGGSSTTTDKIDVKDFSFKPSKTTVKVGTAVTWTMQDSDTTHTVTATDGSFDSGDLSSVGKTFSHTFGSAGTFNYKCSIHNSMTGTVVVQ